MPFYHVSRLASLRLGQPGSRFSIAQTTRRPFHCSRALHDDSDGRSHYETLNVQSDASPADIKKSFYKLSKAHHPDHNPSDPDAAGRFMKISAAYTVLSSPEKRAVYDREHGHHRHLRHAAGPPRGSYSSTGPAGGRPASGLSRRRGTFSGPPPSFYRNGGWGDHGAKRAAAQEKSTGGGATGGGNAGLGGGMGHGDGVHWEDVPHFDRDSHERTHRRMDRRRAMSAAEAAAAGLRDDGEAGFAAKFVVVSAILFVGIMIPATILGRQEEPSSLQGDDKKKKANTNKSNSP